MNGSNEETMNGFRLAPRLGLGKNTCSNCNQDFIVYEYPLAMPGTKDLESVYCPYCETYNGEVFINGLALTKKSKDREV
jgi:hypothetical protein